MSEQGRFNRAAYAIQRAFDILALRPGVRTDIENEALDILSRALDDIKKTHTIEPPPPTPSPIQLATY
jgi:hypothetical protein